MNLNDAQETLVSLYNLIQEIPGMTVNENIQKQVLNSLNSINKCHELIDLGDFEGASLSAIDAVVYAEGAFFDGSLVSLLYFPVEHKYAVYMPFFVPALVPVFSSFFGYIKRARLGQV